MTKCDWSKHGATPHSGQTSDMPLVMQVLSVFRNRQWPERNWASVVRTRSTIYNICQLSKQLNGLCFIVL